MFATVLNTRLPKFMSPVTEPRALVIDALSQDWQGKLHVHVSTFSPAQQSHSEAQDHSGRRGDTYSPLVAVTTMVSTSTTSVCGPPCFFPYRQDLLSQQGFILSSKSYHLLT